jgi:endonuclease/exonuclease/phosphatase family metal-dependent hydrolase
MWTAIWVHRRFSWQLVERRQEDEIEKGCTACALVEVDVNKSLLVYGTVLPWLSDDRRTDLTGTAAFIKSLHAQSAEWTVLKREHPQAHLCVAGDFNQSYKYERYYGTKLGQQRLRQELDFHDLVCPTGIQDPLPTHYGRAPKY